MRPSSTPDALLIAGTASALARAGELIEAHRAVREVRSRVIRGRSLPARWRGELDGVAAVIVLADPARPVAEVVEGTLVREGRMRVPVGVMPDDPRALRGASVVQGRAGGQLGRGPAAVLSRRETHGRANAEELAGILSRSGIPTRDLPEGRIGRAALLDTLGGGPGLVIYRGHGNPLGWAAYGGLQAWEFDRPGASRLGVVLSITCSGSARLGSGHGFSENLVERGLAACAFGAVADTDQEANSALALALAERIAAGAPHLAAALTAELPGLHDYRISGDPLAPFVGARGSRRRLELLFAPAAGDPLPPADWSR